MALMLIAIAVITLWAVSLYRVFPSPSCVPSSPSFLSDGNAHGKGNIRKEELYWACATLKISTSIFCKYTGPAAIWTKCFQSCCGERVYSLINRHPRKSYLAMAEHQSRVQVSQIICHVLHMYIHEHHFERSTLALTTKWLAILFVEDSYTERKLDCRCSTRMRWGTVVEDHLPTLLDKFFKSMK